MTMIDHSIVRATLRARRYHARLAHDGSKEGLQLCERGLKVLVCLAVVCGRARVVLPKVLDRERREPVRNVLVDTLLKRQTACSSKAHANTL